MVKKKDLKTHEKILEAARKIFLEQGMAGARMQDIADEAGINKALLHYYYRDKDKLFETVFIEEAQKFFPKINRIFESEDSLEEKIRFFVAEYIEEMKRSPYLPWFVLNEINRDPDRFLSKVWGKENLPRPAKFLEQMEKEIRKGTIKRIDPRQLVMHLISMTIFPFLARPMIVRNLGIPGNKFNEIMEERKREIPRFIMDSLRKDQ
jgi:AcrR family transcriptional regulator